MVSTTIGARAAEQGVSNHTALVMYRRGGFYEVTSLVQVITVTQVPRSSKS